MNIKIPISNRLMKIFWTKRHWYIMPTFTVTIHEQDGYYLVKKRGFVLSIRFIGLNIEFWSYNLFKDK